MSPSIDLDLADQMAEFYGDPLGFVRFSYRWGEPGPLEAYPGPVDWQRDLLFDIGAEVRKRRFDGIHAVDPIRIAVASGHGIGKSSLSAWLVDWILSTRPNCQGTVTANTFPQLQTKTWAQLQKWTQLSITGHWFEISNKSIHRRDQQESWGVSAQTCREENSESFAGQHAASSTSFYLFDEASAIPEKIWEVAEGGLTDGEPMIFAFGNATRSVGKFNRIVFGSERERWNHRSIDSRTCSLTNKQQIAQWIQDYGEDSDFVRVRVRGLPPRASELQFIDQQRVWDAQQRETFTLPDEPIVAGVDCSDGGVAWNVIRFRRGLDARSIPPIRIPGEHTRNDRSVLLGRLAEILRDQRASRRVAMMFVDSAFGAPYVERLQQMGFRNVQEVRFGGGSPDRHQANMRAYMWAKLKDWLLRGSIDPKDTDIELDLVGPGYHINKSDQLVIEAKEEMAKRGVKSPDDGDALALTFAQPLGPRISAPAPSPYRNLGERGWMA